MGTRTKEVRVCDQCGNENGVWQTCLVCEMELCTNCCPGNRHKSFPFDKLFITVCNLCQEEQDVEELRATIEEEWREMQAEWKGRVDELPKRKHETWEDSSER